MKEQRTLIDKKRIEAPFAGELGIRLVNLGQFITAGQPIVTLQSIAPIYVNFSLPETRYPAITRGQVVEVAVDAFPERRFAGTVNAINPEVRRPATSTCKRSYRTTRAYCVPVCSRR